VGGVAASEGKPRAPEPLGAAHELVSFDCGEPELDTWLKRRALPNEVAGASRTYVVCDSDRAIGFYSLATGAIMRARATGSVRRNMPDPIPVMIIGRMAVDRAWQGRGIGRAMLQDAIKRTLQAASLAGIRAILVHAKSDAAKSFYEACGFRGSPVEPLTLMITVAEAARALLD
jgi:GNAT superfamily N-acetyltransferase